MPSQRTSRSHPTASTHLVASLAREARRHPVGRKVLVAPTVGGGRELLRRLALEHGGWVGFEVTTPRPLALELARETIARRSLSALDPFEQLAYLDEALDAALLGVSGVWADLSESVGFRERVHEAVLALRLAGIDATGVRRARLRDTEKRGILASVLYRYERLLVERGRLDTAGVFALAASELEGGAVDPQLRLDAEAILLQPGLGVRGAAGRLAAALTGRGGRVLRADPTVGRDIPDALLWSRGDPASGHAFFDAPDRLPEELERPGVTLFQAASITDELREVLRRVVARGLRWDEVEIVTPDPAAYGSALHALSLTLGVPVTYAVGLPLERTRVGRVVHAYLDWVAEGFQAAPVRRLLEAGDLRPPRSRARVPAAALARRFRTLRIGWGRKRYRSTIRDALDGLEVSERRRTETEERHERRKARVRDELSALRSIFFPVLRETPSVPDRATEAGRPVSAAELARGLRAFLRRVPRGRGPERAARDEVLRILERVESTLRRRTHFRGALAVLRRHLEIRVRADVPDPAGGEDPGAPWASEGGHLHLSDLEHGGYTGRRAVFFVGMDADRFPGHGGQDPLLLDADRRILGRALPTSIEIARERSFRLAALFARIRGEVTLSYAAWDPVEARAPSPSPALLQALRLGNGDPSLTFEDLREALGSVVCAVPSEDRTRLDADDVWMARLGDGPVLRHGIEAICEAYPGLGAGYAAARRRALGDPGPVHGVVTPRPDALDPRRDEAIVLSSGRMEGLGGCPLSYLHRSVLGLYPPDDPESDPDRWLDHRQRGVLLHGVFEASLRGATDAGIAHMDPRFEALALERLEAAASELRRELPVPGEGTLRRELSALRDDVRSFVRMVREHGAPWARLEFGFGFDDEPVRLDVPGGGVRYRGVVDRVDDLGMDGIRVVDYKTGVPRDFGKTGTFHGGRRLQHALYAHAVETRLDAPVVAGEYHFPTLRGEHEIHRFGRADLEGAPALIGHMLDGVAEGRFVPTDDANDCRLCDFAEICRVRRGSFGSVDSPLAEWSKERAATGTEPAFRNLRAVRTFEE